MSGKLASALVAARLQATVGQTSKVWNALGNPVDPKAFADRYVNDKAISAYEVTREASEPIEGGNSEAITRRERVVIAGYHSFKDGVSEPIFQAQVDAITAAFDPPSVRQFQDEFAELQADDPDGTLTGGAAIDWSSAPTVEGPRIARLGQVLVHYVRITVSVEFGPIF